MARAPGLSVRLKLTLSYAGFLMLAGAVLLAAGYFSLSRGVHPGVIFLVQSHAALLRYFAPIAAIVMAFLLVFGLVGGWILAGRMLAPLTRITDATRMAANGWGTNTLKKGDVITAIGYRFTDGSNVLRLQKIVMASGKEMFLYGR